MANSCTLCAPPEFFAVLPAPAAAPGASWWRFLRLPPRRSAPDTAPANGAGTAIRFAILETQLGKLLVALTDKGICSIQFGERENDLERDLRKQFSQAEVSRDDAGLEQVTSKITDYLQGRRIPLDLPLD